MSESNNDAAETIAQVVRTLNAGTVALRSWLQSQPVVEFVAGLQEALQRWTVENRELIERAMYNHNLMLERSQYAPLSLLRPLAFDPVEPEESETEGAGDPSQRHRLN